MTIYSETFDGRGNLEKIEEQFFDLDYSNGPDEPESRLISAFEDGKDVTDKKRKELEKGDRRGGPPGGEDMEGMDRPSARSRNSVRRNADLQRET